MSNAKKIQAEDLKKLEDQAYFELCQIIAEAMQYQDIELLNARIASWKNKYKKLLDMPSTSSKSDFKKRIEFLLNQYYSSVTQYILSQLKLKEEKKIENQSKALKELYRIIKNTNDLDLLKNKVENWKDKYPISSFLRMYQRRIAAYTREKNLKENAFEQEQAFLDLINITKIHGTLDELKNELTLWEEKYSINNKYNIDDFIKHQTEVKRYTSDEFLQSIAREDIKSDNIDKTDTDIVEEYNNKSFSNLSVQASAYASLVKISKSPNNINEMFTWVYKNSNIKFNDKHKELILSATYLDYSPTYLNKIPKPKMDISKNSLSFDEYNNIDNIKKYAIISYFNLLLPPEKAIANDYFNKHIQTINTKSEKARISNIKDETVYINDIADPEIENSLKEPIEENAISYVAKVDLEPIELSPDKEVVEDTAESIQPLEIANISESEIVIDISNTEPELTISLNKPEEEDKSEIEGIPQKMESGEKDDTEKTLDYNAIVAISPLFFEAINNYDKQAVLVNHIDSATTKYVESEKAKEVSLNNPLKTKNNIE